MPPLLSVERPRTLDEEAVDLNNINSDSYFEVEDTASTSDKDEIVSRDRKAIAYVKIDDEALDLKDNLQRKKYLSYIQPAEPVHAPSIYEGYVPPYPKSSEADVVCEFCIGDGDSKGRLPPSISAIYDGEEYLEFDLCDFTIYTPHSMKYHGGEMRGLQNSTSTTRFRFDGVLVHQGSRRYVENVEFDLCSIGNYGQAEYESVDGELWIQSTLNMKDKKSNIWYRLKNPSKQYERFHVSFLWIVDLAKHFVDYMLTIQEEGGKVSIHNFRSAFSGWLNTVHSNSSKFKRWYKQHDNADFRCAVVAHIEFLYKEAIGAHQLFDHTIWNEVKNKDYIPAQPRRKAATTIGNGKGALPVTIVTPYVYDCFSHLKSGVFLEAVTPMEDVEVRRKSVGQILNLTVEGSITKSAQKAANQSYAALVEDPLSQTKFDPSSISVGDVVALAKDDSKLSMWREELSKWNIADECWYAYIQSIHVVQGGKRTFRAIWLYKPSETTCALMKYPYANERFFSDHCTCLDTDFYGKDCRIQEDEILFKVSVDWNGSPGGSGAFFIRQTYIIDDNSFITLKDIHKTCCHIQEDRQATPVELTNPYRLGDTVLVEPHKELKSKYELEPAEVVNFSDIRGQNYVVLRRLQRCSDFYIDAQISHVDRQNCVPRCNELAYTDETYTALLENVHRRCHVRYYTIQELVHRQIPTPYDRGGTGDMFYITSRLTTMDDGSMKLQPLTPAERSQSLRQGFDPKLLSNQARLRHMDLFSGGGTFGRGLEEGGAAESRWAVDMDANAIHTYYANLKTPKDAHLFHGSVDDFLYHALNGNPKGSDLIPVPGEVDFISAGSPCTGFSLLNHVKDNQNGLKNQSLVSSVAAFVDFYRPKYALLENVISMAKKSKGRDEDMLSQLICCFVGMGYQVQIFVLDAWSFGSPQTRTRLFVSIAAPGLKLPPPPPLTHSHIPGTFDRALGKMSNGEIYGKRRFDAAPFKYMTAGEATEDLPNIGDGRTYFCASHPDHRMSKEILDLLAVQIRLIPLSPVGMNYYRTLQAGLLKKVERQLFPLLALSGKSRQNSMKGSRAWERLNPQKLFPTITTACSPEDARSGKTLHWEQQRLMTILEARRAQGYPDNEVLIGIPTKQWKIVGNSVDRHVALGLGLSLREAWLAEAGAPQDCAPHPEGVLPYQAHQITPSPGKSRYSQKLHRLVDLGGKLASEVISISNTTSSDESISSYRKVSAKMNTAGDISSTSCKGQTSSSNSSLGETDAQVIAGKKRSRRSMSTEKDTTPKQKKKFTGEISNPGTRRIHDAANISQGSRSAPPKNTSVQVRMGKVRESGSASLVNQRCGFEFTALTRKLQAVKEKTLERSAESDSDSSVSPRTATTSSPFKSKPSAEEPKLQPTVIDMSSESESVEDMFEKDLRIEHSEEVDERKANAYVLVDNTRLDAYAKTNIMLRRSAGRESAPG